MAIIVVNMFSAPVYMSCSTLPLPEVGDKAHQPLNFSFPQREFGKSKSSVVKRSFQAQCFQRWPSGHAHGYVTMLIVTKLSAFRVSGLTGIGIYLPHLL